MRKYAYVLQMRICATLVLIYLNCAIFEFEILDKFNSFTLLKIKALSFKQLNTRLFLCKFSADSKKNIEIVSLYFV